MVVLEKAIIVENITKKYKLYSNSKERLLDLISPKSVGEDFYALTNVNFKANYGEVVGFIGINGSGKSTLSNIIAGVVPETSGKVTVNGQIQIIAVNIGLKNDLTGRDNIELKLLMLGFSKEEIKELEPSIIEFSELGKFIDQPVKSYSSGMKSRLGFAISVNVDPDILIIDEALSVGDKAFAEKSLQKMKEFKAEGKTMIFVSHSIGQMRQFCDKILWLEFGMVKDYGTVEEVIPRYESFLNKWRQMNNVEREQYRKKAYQIQRKLLSGNKVESYLNIDNFINKNTIEPIKESPVSLLGHIRGGESVIYDSPYNLEKGKSSNKYKHKVYYIKKQLNIEGKRFYLLSKEPSAVNGIIGWMSSSDLLTHKHIIVDNDPKSFIFTGKGVGFSHPWGGKKDVVVDDLSNMKGKKFSVTNTNFVGNNIWYKGRIEKNQFWIHESYLE